MAPTWELPLPEEDIEYKLAYKLLAKENTLDKRILLRLVGRDTRYSDLKVLLGDKAENNLTEALHRLRDDGLIVQRSDVRKNPPVNHYELSALGQLVVLRMMQMVPAHESAEALRRGKARVDAEAANEASA